MKLFLASDHAGAALRAQIIEHLRQSGREVVDLGPEAGQSVDYPDYALKVSREVAAHKDALGILVCGTGIGMSMTANRVTGIRAAACTHEYMARMARAHNDANVLCLGERVIGTGVALGIVDTFLATEFEGGRHSRRVSLIDAAKG
ncbi:MAG: ribose 5-phosphate isomerase B [Myxococcota bacterium]